MLSNLSFESKVESFLSRGDVIGDWRVVAYLGKGLSAEVYRVIHVRYGHDAALKLFVADSENLRARFVAEADAIASISLKCLPRFMGFGVHECHAYYVMEYLEPLPERIRRRDIPGFVNRLAKAVQTLHELGFIHRDLKPGNVMLRPNGEIVLIDLGLLKRADSSAALLPRFEDSLSIVDGKPVGVGTYGFSAPEQMMGAACSIAGDVYSLGKIAAALYLKNPPRSMRRVIIRATNDQPCDRYASAQDFARAVRHRNLAWEVTLAVVFSLSLLGVFGYPHLKPFLVERFGRTQPITFISLAKHPSEADAAYLARLLPLAEEGNLEAEVAVAEAYFYGRGVETNRVVSVDWYRRAAEKGHSAAQASLAMCLFNGIGCEKDRESAAIWNSRAADQGDLSAMNNLAFAYLNGLGVARNPEAGFALALKAANNGYPAAQTLVAECYRDGRGVEKDSVQAETWLYRAARLGNTRAKRLLEER